MGYLQAKKVIQWRVLSFHRMLTSDFLIINFPCGARRVRPKNVAYFGLHMSE